MTKKSNIEYPFSFLKDKDIEFLISLNLDDEQYVKLAKIIEDFGYSKYYEGNVDEYNNQLDLI